MAINFTVSYTFSPNTTIASSQVNTNTTDVANVFTGLEAGTTTMGKLIMDSDPATALAVATKQYVDHYSTYRRPVLQYSSATVVNLETGINGTSGQATILFPDGNLRTDSTSSRINFDITRNAALSGSAQSGLRTSLSEATNTWYALYAVKVSDNSSNFVVVGDTVLPLQANYATLNSNFGTSSWVYLGMIRNGDNGSATGDILSFVQAGHLTLFKNNNSGLPGTLLATTSGTSLTYSISSGTGTAQIPNHVLFSYFLANSSTSGGQLVVQDSGANYNIAIFTPGSSGSVVCVWAPSSAGVKVTANSSTIIINLIGFVDGVLGVGANPLL